MVEERRKKGPVTRRYRLTYDLNGTALRPPEADAPLREHRRWAEAFKLLYPEGDVVLESLPGPVPTVMRRIRATVRR